MTSTSGNRPILESAFFLLVSFFFSGTVTGAAAVLPCCCWSVAVAFPSTSAGGAGSGVESMLNPPSGPDEIDPKVPLGALDALIRRSSVCSNFLFIDIPIQSGFNGQTEDTETYRNLSHVRTD